MGKKRKKIKSKQKLTSCQESLFPYEFSQKLLKITSCKCMCTNESHFSCVRLCVTPWTIASQIPLSMGFSRQEYWSGLPCSSSGDLPNLGIEPMTPTAPALLVDSLSTEPPREPCKCTHQIIPTKVSLCKEVNVHIRVLPVFINTVLYNKCHQRVQQFSDPLKLTAIGFKLQNHWLPPKNPSSSSE